MKTLLLALFLLFSACSQNTATNKRAFKKNMKKTWQGDKYKPKAQ